MGSSLSLVPLSNSFLTMPIAHRGFHDCAGTFGSGKTENSIAAFKSAISRGYGIEVDIQMTADGTPIVFHDKSLKRLLNIDKNISDLSLSSIKKLRLENNEQIPTFDEFLELVSGQVPILVEFKEQDGFMTKNIGRFEDAVARSLEKYKGLVAVMSFNPYFVKNFGLILPEIPRGLVTEDFTNSDWSGLTEQELIHRQSISTLEEIGASFISHLHTDLTSNYISSVASKINIFSWTVRSKKELEIALKRSDNVTFEGFSP